MTKIANSRVGLLLLAVACQPGGGPQALPNDPAEITAIEGVLTRWYTAINAHDSAGVAAPCCLRSSSSKTRPESTATGWSRESSVASKPGVRRPRCLDSKPKSAATSPGQASETTKSGPRRPGAQTHCTSWKPSSSKTKRPMDDGALPRHQTQQAVGPLPAASSSETISWTVSRPRSSRYHVILAF